MVLGKMKSVFLIVLGIVVILSMSQVSAVCSVTFDKSSNYSLGETITVTMNCSEVAEKIDTYFLNWTNGTGFQVQLDSGTTPSNVDENFFQTFIIPDNYTSVNGNNITATLIGDDDKRWVLYLLLTGSVCYYVFGGRATKKSKERKELEVDYR